MYLDGFKGVFTNRSAVMCLSGFLLTIAGFQVGQIYGASFFREHFQISTEITALLVLGGSLTFFLGTLGSGQVVTKWGRKYTSVWTIFIASLSLIAFTNIPNLELTVTIFLLGNIIGGVGLTAITSLTLEQVPQFRGTMMSMFSAAMMAGAALGASLGGWILLRSTYGMVGLVLGGLCIGSVLIYALGVSDPTTER